MQSQLTVRLSDELSKEILTLVKKVHLKRSDIVRLALEKFLEETKEKEETRPYKRIKSLIGSTSSGISDLGEAHRSHLLKRFKKDAQCSS